MSSRLFLIFAILFSCPEVFGQDLLLFQKNNHRQAKYYKGDVLKFYLKGEKSARKSEIIDFQDSLIVFKNYKLHPAEISHLHLDNQTRSWFIVRYKYDRALPIAGGAYLLADGINNGVSEETGIISGSLVGAGLFAYILIKKRIKIKGRRKLMVIDI
ncbi:MAG: hypothetical protein AAF363_17515 [Bacteroidota bacterium]